MTHKCNGNEPESIDIKKNDTKVLSRRNAIKAVIAGTTLVAAGRVLPQSETQNKQNISNLSTRNKAAILFQYGGEFGNLKTDKSKGV